jgi:hypothetical protein
MFPSDEQDVAKTFLGQVPAFRGNLLHTKGDAEDRIITRESAVTAVVDAFVRKVKRREKPHRSPKISQGQRMRLLSQRFQLRIRFRRNETLEPAQERRLLEWQIVQDLSERHRATNSLGPDLSQLLMGKRGGGGLSSVG